MSNWENNVRKVVPYVPGDQPQYPDMIKLNTNENPYPPAPGVAEVLKNLNADVLRLYPKPDAHELAAAIAEECGVDFNNVFVGVGSDDVLGTAFLTFFKGDLPVLFPDVTYSFYPVWAELYNIPYETPALDGNFRIKKEDYYKPNGGIVIANPNAPTTIAEPLDFIEDIVKHNKDSVVIVDEAYVDFGGETALELTRKYENLLVVRTFSKSRNLAGMRIGFAIGSEKLISYMMAVRNSYNSYTMTTPSILCGEASIKDKAYFRKTVDKITATREKAVPELQKLGFTCLDSSANFLFATHKTVPAKEIFTKLREKHIFVRYFDKPRINNYLRITIGTDNEMQQLYAALSEILK
ncbi:MAG: histidinol-phosphate transaminase [Lachnospiraceae bacterium]|nr:histidinol-phosphate transaminase [Lachnospiraceae bacterium]